MSTKHDTNKNAVLLSAVADYSMQILPRMRSLSAVPVTPFSWIAGLILPVLSSV